MNSHAASIPLQCFCCAKRPKFSDVSHLLTHVQSKGHLSQYYKLKIKAGCDADARKLVDDFDEWYTRYDVENLMQDRMSIKDRKRVRSRGSTKARGGGSGSRTNARLTRAGYRESSNLSHFDPRLTDSQLKHENSASPFGSPAMFTPALSQYGNHWLNARPAALQFQAGLHDWADHTSESSALTSLASTDLSIISEELLSTEHNDNHAIADNCKLKGDYGNLPGMGIFDSATPDERRKRNQKKDPSVIRMLQHNSTLIDDTECVWSSDGNFQRGLKITGLPEDDATSSSPPKRTPRQPIHGPSSPRATATRNILSEIELNGRHRSSRMHTIKREFDENPSRMDEQLEQDLTYGHRQKRQRIEIYQELDSPRHRRSDMCAALDQGSVQMPWLTTSFQPLAQVPSMTQRKTISSGQNVNAKLFSASQQIMYHPEKENCQPLHPATVQLGLYNAGLPMDQYHHQRRASVTTLSSALFSPQNAYYIQPSQDLASLSPLKLSPLKLGGLGRRPSDDDRTITAPNSEA